MKRKVEILSRFLFVDRGSRVSCTITSLPGQDHKYCDVSKTLLLATKTLVIASLRLSGVAEC